MAAAVAEGMLPDGSNPEAVDPNPPLEWKSKDDLTNLEVYGTWTSPATNRLRAYLTYYNVPYKPYLVANKKGSSYQKVPVLVAGGRQVNDTYIILKHLLPALGLEFNTEWEEKIIFHFTFSLLAAENPSELVKTAVSPYGPGIPKCMACILKCFIPGFIKKINKRNLEAPNTKYKSVDPVEFLKEFKAAMNDKPFHGGDDVGPVDLSLYGTMSVNILFETSVTMGAIEQAGLTDWLNRMKEKVPLKRMFPGTRPKNGVVYQG